MTSLNTAGEAKIASIDVARRTVIVSVAVSAALLTLFLATLAISPMNGEDYGLTLPLAANHGLVSIMRAVWAHALHWNSRFGELAAMVEFDLPRPVFLLAQSGGAVVLVVGTALLSLNRSEDKGLAIAASAILYVLFWPRLELFYWNTVGAGYLQPLAICVVLLLIVRDAAASWKSILSCTIVGLICGFSFENTGPALTLFFIVIWWFGGRSWSMRPPLALYSAGAVLFGWIALMLVPSTAYRMTYYKTHMHQPALSLQYLEARAHDVAVTVLSASWPLIAIAILGAVVMVVSRDRSRASIYIWCLLVPAAVLVGGLVVAPYTEARAASLAWVILTAFALRGGVLVARRWPLLSLLTIGTAGVIAIGVSIWVWELYADVAMQSMQRTNSVLAAIHTPACASGVPFPRLISNAPIRVMNLREVWTLNSAQTQLYFGCKLTGDYRG